MSGVREVLFVGLTIVMVVRCQALAGRHQRSSPTDEPVSVSFETKQTSGTLVGKCMKPKTASFKVRFAAIKGQTTSFSRALMDMPTIETYASKLQNVSSRHIGHCAVLAEAGGFEGFSFNNGMCKMFSLERQPCRRDAGTGDVIYVQDSFWDEKDLVLPLPVPAASGPVEYVRYPSTLIDQRDKFTNAFHGPIDDPNNIQLLAYASIIPGVYKTLCKGLECFLTIGLTTEHCATGCVGCSDWILRTPLIFDDEGIPEVVPTKYFLSNCGQTINVNEPFPKNGTKNVVVIPSHEGFGCEWYPKPAEDQDCIVTLSSTHLIEFTFYVPYVDGDSSTCDGDNVSVYDGASTAGRLVETVTACKKSPWINFFSNTVTVVFRRSATQYRTDGFNAGFVLHISSRKT